MADASFKAFEREGWQGIPREYDEGFGSLTAQSIAPLLDAAGVGAGSRVLDVATGPGYVAAQAAARGAEVIAIDFAKAMVEEAGRRVAGVEFRAGDAEALAFDEGAFDAVVMNYGVLHLADPDLALREAHRVLRPGGRFAFTAWAAPERAVGFRIVLDAVRLLGDINAPLPPGPPFFRFGDKDECVRALKAGGFASAGAVDVGQTWQLASAEALFDIMLGGTVRTGGLLRAQTPEARARIRQEVSRRASEYRSGTGVALPMPAVLAFAEK